MNSPRFQPIYWTAEDAQAWREFLATPTGQRLQNAIFVEPNSRPTDFAGRPGSAEYTLGMIEGYRVAIAALVTYTLTPTEDGKGGSGKDSGSYPELPPDADGE